MRFGILLITLFLTHFSLAQQKCGTTAPTSGEFENWISLRLEARKLIPQQQNIQATVYQIPVVVHIFHKGEAIGNGTNLSNERIIGQIDSLTADFRRTNADAVNTPSDFVGVAADTEIEFVLARQDPQGNPTNGIVRINGEKKTYRVNGDKEQLRSESFWPPENYLNIYVADLQTFLGYAAFPVTTLEGIDNENDDFVLDAVYVDYEYFGNNPDAPSFESRGRTLTHEIGHFLGLRHIWGDAGCSGDDFVDDTPTARFDHGGTKAPCTYPIPDEAATTSYDEGNTCTEEDDPDLPDMFQNFLDYTDDICMNLFTQGQKDRMRIVIENSPRRNSLITSPGLAEPVRFENDLAATKIISPDQANCSNQITPVLLVTNYGTNDVTSFDVQLMINGSPVGAVFSSSNVIPPLSVDTIVLSNQIVSAIPSTLSFTIFNVNGTIDGNPDNNTLTKSLNHLSSINLPFFEDFETGNLMMETFGMSSIWEVVTAPREMIGNQSLVLKAHGNTSSFGEETIVETPALDLNGVPSAALTFSYAYADNPGSFQDGLVVKASTDCGETFKTIFHATGSDLKTASATTSPFTPANQLEWADTTLGISEFRDFDEVKFQFVGLNGGTNNLYIDNILIEETNLLPNDVNLRSIRGALVTCKEEVDLNLQIRNSGSDPITSFKVEFNLNGTVYTNEFKGINVGEREYETFSLEVTSLIQNTNEITVNVVEVNGVADQSEFGNTVSAFIERNLIADEYPLIVDFESSDDWFNVSPVGTTSIWKRSTEGNNGVLVGESFDETELGIESWFISPALTTGDLDSAGLYFRASYASRSGLNDRLRVLASTDCGEDYNITLLEADADSLAVTQTSDKWVPTSDADWKEYRLDLSSTIPFRDDIRIAFVFINGNGNDLYIDDISIRSNEPPGYQQLFRVYPNPANQYFHLGFDLERKEEVTVELINMSGKVMSRQTVSNALNQSIRFDAPYQSGMYFLRVSGSNFAQIQKLFITPN